MVIVNGEKWLNIIGYYDIKLSTNANKLILVLSPVFWRPKDTQYVKWRCKITIYGFDGLTR